MEHQVDRLCPVRQGRDQGQQEMECHPGQRSDPGYRVPLWRLTESSGDQVHLMRSEKVTDQTGSENDQVLAVKTLSAAAENRVRIEDQRQRHPHDGLRQHKVVHSLLDTTNDEVIRFKFRYATGATTSLCARSVLDKLLIVRCHLSEMTGASRVTVI